jgi:hypothetical protein
MRQEYISVFKPVLADKRRKMQTDHNRIRVVLNLIVSVMALFRFAISQVAIRIMFVIILLEILNPV